MADTFDSPWSRNEAILQNMLGAVNDLGEPQSRIETLLMELLELINEGATIETPLSEQEIQAILDAIS